jgi:ABC-type branched-subunit amino acid transport system ATPase component
VIGLPLTGNLWPWGSENDIAIGNGVILVVALAGVMFFASRTITSQVGLELFMLGANETTAAAMGVATPRRRLELFVTGSTLATLGGALYAGSQLFVPWTLVTSSAQFSLLLMLFLGGRRSALGAVIGSLFIQYFAGISLFVAIHILLIEGALVTLILLIEPDGLAGIAVLARRLVADLLQARRTTEALAGSGGEEAGTAASSVLVRSSATSDPDHLRDERWPRGPGSADLLVINDLVKSFGGLEVLDHIDLSLPAAGIFGLCGPNGAGKSILLNTIGGNLPPSSGRVLLGGQDVTYLSAHEHFDLGVARTFQTVQLVAGRTVLDNVAVTTLKSKHGSPLRGVFDAAMPEALERAEAALELLGIEELRHRDVASLTLEGQRMVELARAMAPRPRLLLLDEPASGLSAPQRDALKTTLRSVSTITTVLLVEHDLHLVADIAEKILVLLAGRPVFEGNSEEFYQSELVQSVLIGRSERTGLRPHRPRLV